MSTRKIKDAKDLNTGELIYFKGHAQATFMSDGRTVEEAVSGISGESGGTIDTSNLATKAELAQKQDKLVSGTNIKNVYTTNGDTSILGSGELHLAAVRPSTSKVVATGIWNNFDVINISTAGLEFIPESEDPDNPRWSIHRSGDGTKFLADDGTYKTISSGGGSSSSGITSVKINGVSKSPSSGVVDLGYINKQLSTSTSSSMTLSPNIYYRNTSTSLSTLTIKLGSASNSNIINEYFVEFTTRSAGTTVSLPSTIKWANGETPTFEASTTYQISIVNNLGVVTKFK